MPILLQLPYPEFTLGMTPVVPYCPCRAYCFYCLEHPALYVPIIRNQGEIV